MKAIVWEPSPEYAEQSQLARFMQAVGCQTYSELLARSEEDPVWFWESFIRYSGLKFYEPYRTLLDLSKGLPWPKWLLGARLNLAQNFLDRWALRPDWAGRVALVWEGEEGDVRRYTFRELWAQANRVAWALQGLGLRRGDRVALFMPMVPETVVAVYGIYKAGGVIVPLFTGFGPEAVAQRLADVEARFVIAADGFRRNGRAIHLGSVLNKALDYLSNPPRVILLNQLGVEGGLSGAVPWEEVAGGKPEPAPLTEPMESEETALVAYSSGTTGRPKGVVHTHGGLTLKTAESGMLVFDVRPEDTVLFITDFGWMMGQFTLFIAHAVGATYAMYEGAPLYPDPDRLFRLIERHRISVFGAPATALRLLKVQAHPEEHDLSSLRILAHTGEPIDEDTWLWYFSWGGGQVPIINGSGGTEVYGEIISSTVVQPLKPACLGVTPAVGPRVVDEEGKPVPPGTPGYLVFTLPQPAQTRGFWREPERYLETYFPLGPNLWWHGDTVLVDSEGFWFHLGRADDVIKVAGRRTGPGEIEEVANRDPRVLESAAIGVPDPIRGEVIVLFVVPRPGRSPDPENLRQSIAEALGRPYAPERIYVVPDLPKTRNQKILRRLIRRRYLGEPLGDLSSLLNPEALEHIPTREVKG